MKELKQKIVEIIANACSDWKDVEADYPRPDYEFTKQYSDHLLSLFSQWLGEKVKHLKQSRGNCFKDNGWPPNTPYNEDFENGFNRGVDTAIKMLEAKNKLQNEK